MIVTCPSCSARYAVDADKIGPSGRRVKCAKCGHTWQQEPPELEEEVVAAPEPERPGIGEEAREPDDDDFSPDLDDDFRSQIEASADEFRPGRRSTGKEYLPAVPRTSSRWPARLAWLLLLVVVLSAIGGTIAFRDSVIAALPAAKKLYDAAGLMPVPPEERIGVRGVSHAYEKVDGADVLKIEGELVNTADVPGDVPDLRVLFVDDAGAILKRWTFAPPERRMLPGEVVKFSTRVTSPPAAAKRIDVGFDIGTKKE